MGLKCCLMKITLQNIKDYKPNNEDKSASYILVEDVSELPSGLQKIDGDNDGIITSAIKNREFKAKFGGKLDIYTPKNGLIVLIGTHKKDDEKFSLLDAEKLGGKIAQCANGKKLENVTALGDVSINGISSAKISAYAASGAELGSYKFNKYFTKKLDDKENTVTSLNFFTQDNEEAESIFQDQHAVNEGVFLTRDVVSEPPNILYPEHYSDIVKAELRGLGVKVEVLGEREMRKLGMGSLLSVGMGSTKESQLVIMKYENGPKNDAPLAFVGKGVTFDTGGISLKPSKGMEDMKYDMAGSGVVCGIMKALASRKAKVNAIGVIGLVENMPDGNASRPSDVVKSMSGQTIEILNTDAEGRLVLADALWYTQDKYKPKFMIDFATLTGAIVVSLANHYSGLFSNNDELSENITKAGQDSGERTWRLPMGDEYDKMIDSKTADVQNISNGYGGGSITAAQFLQRFVNDVPWAHLDIAGVEWKEKGEDVYPWGASGYGVRLIDRMVRDYYEK